MTKTTVYKHTALHFSDESKADLFFNKILGLSILKEFVLSNKLSNKIFDINSDVKVKTYGNKDITFEVFITDKKSGFQHTCIQISDKNDFIKRCKDNDLEPKFIKKGDKTLLFIKDYFGNLYEIKEKNNKK